MWFSEEVAHCLNNRADVHFSKLYAVSFPLPRKNRTIGRKPYTANPSHPNYMANHSRCEARLRICTPATDVNHVKMDTIPLSKPAMDPSVWTTW